MRVLQIAPRYFPNTGGVETVVQKLSESLADMQIEVSVFSVDRDARLAERQIVNGIQVKRFRALVSDPVFFPSLKLLVALRRENAEIIHVHNVHTLPPFFTAIFKKRHQKLVLQPHYHRFGQTRFRHLLLKLYTFLVNHMVLHRVDIVIANSPYEKRILQEDFSRIQNLTLIPEGIDISELEKVKRHPRKPSRILYVGALKRYKNVDKVIEGFARLTRKRNRAFRLVIIGRGPELDALQELSHKLGVDDYIEWKHDLSRTQLLKEYAEASVFVHLSPLESFSRVVYEAVLTGVPTVVLNFGATKAFVATGLATGVSSLDPAEIADALLKAAETVQQKPREQISMFLDWRQYVERIVHVYHELEETARSQGF